MRQNLWLAQVGDTVGGPNRHLGGVGNASIAAARASGSSLLVMLERASRTSRTEIDEVLVIPSFGAWPGSCQLFWLSSSPKSGQYDDLSALARHRG